jgi:hypothetical protein
MAVIIDDAFLLEVGIETTDANRELDAFRQDTVTKLKDAGDKGGKALSDGVVPEIKKVGEEAKRAADAAEKMLAPEMVKAYVQGLAEVAKGLGLVGKEFDRVASEAQKGAELGGKLGGVAGGLMGALFFGTKEESEQIAEREKARLQEFVDFEIGLHLAAGGAIAKALEARKKKAEQIAKDHAKAEEEAAERAMKAWKKAQEDIFKGVGSIVASVVAGVEDTVDKGTAKLEEMRAKAAAAARELAAFNGALNKGFVGAAEAGRAGQAGALAAFNQGQAGEADAATAALGRQADAWNSLRVEILDAQFAAISFADTGLEMIQQTAKDVGLELQNALGDVGAGAAMALFDALEAGDPILRSLGGAFRDLSSDALKGIGSQLIGQGILDEAKAASLLIKSAGIDPRGWALAAHGAAEIAGGLALGGAGALVGRIGKGGGGGGGRGRDYEAEAGGGGGSLFGGSLSLGKGALGGGGSNSTTNNTYIIQALDVGDRELWERLGARVERGRRAFKRAGGKLFDGRD